MKENERVIFAIGGGELATAETLPIDRMIVATASRRKSRRRTGVRALFIPTASGDESEYCRSFEQIYGGRLGCITDSLFLYADRPAKISLKRLIDWCDLVYVGGGSTPDMIRRWRKFNIDKLLRRAWLSGKVMSGLSAGANCWFRYGLSDARHRRWTTVTCLGFINLACNVHYSSQKGRKKAFDDLVSKRKITGIALDDNACIKIINNKYEIIKSAEEAKAYWIYNQKGNVRRELISQAGQIF